jgi:hypothetical protein
MMRLKPVADYIKSRETVSHQNVEDGEGGAINFKKTLSYW